MVFAKDVPHKFRTPHHDVLERYILYKVPVDKLNDLAAFDGSVLVDRTKGEMSSRCEAEDANFVAFNLASEIVNSQKTVDAARKAYGEAMRQSRAGQLRDITERLTSKVPAGGTPASATARYLVWQSEVQR